jgi:chorismate dehydratase
MTKPHIAASSYLNAAPLCYSFIAGEQKECCTFLSDAAPARCAELLAEGRADAALIPVIEYQRIPNLKIARGACVASKSRVRSVLLVSQVPINEIRSAALDISSRTSAALIQIILGRFYNIEASYRSCAPRLEEMLESNDAALIIGDPAMLTDRSSFHVYDLAEEWRRHTGLPFVFAFWGIRAGSSTWSSNETAIDFEAARREGLAHVEELAESYGKRLGLPPSDLVSYLTESITYDLDDDCLRGLKLYYELARQSGLTSETRDIDFA